MKTKINQAVKKGDLVDYDNLFASYSQKRQQEILKRARYLKTAMELNYNGQTEALNLIKNFLSNEKPSGNKN